MGTQGKHVITLPDGVWELYQGEHGVKNPSRYIREDLLKWVYVHKLGVEEGPEEIVVEEPKIVEEPEPDQNVLQRRSRGHFDPGRTTQARFASPCAACGKSIEKGEDYIRWYKQNFHTDCDPR